MGSHSTLTAESRAVLDGTENLWFRVPPQADPDDVDVVEEEDDAPCTPPLLAFKDGMAVNIVVEDRLKD
jgi:hypothetical protein